MNKKKTLLIVLASFVVLFAAVLGILSAPGKSASCCTSCGCLSGPNGDGSCGDCCDVACYKGGTTAAKRGKINIITDSLKELEKEFGGKPFKKKLLFERAVSKGLTEEDCQKVIDALLRDGTIYSPRVDEIQRTP